MLTSNFFPVLQERNGNRKIVFIKITDIINIYLDEDGNVTVSTYLYEDDGTPKTKAYVGKLVSQDRLNLFIEKAV